MGAQRHQSLQLINYAIQSFTFDRQFTCTHDKLKEGIIIRNTFQRTAQLT